MSITSQVTIVLPNSNALGASFVIDEISVLSLISIKGISMRLLISFVASDNTSAGCVITGSVVSTTVIV